MVVLSDYEYASEKLNALGIDNSQFDWVVSAPKLGGLKPAHQVLEKVLETMGYTPKQCLVIGDREDTDGQLAQSVGTAFYRV
jgi:FMN phosphatase YigB (HAD superfamily)